MSPQVPAGKMYCIIMFVFHHTEFISSSALDVSCAFFITTTNGSLIKVQCYNRPIVRKILFLKVKFFEAIFVIKL
jgi:hypothetical protein